MIYYVAWIILAGIVFFFGYKFFKRPELRYDYTDMVKHNNSIRGTNEKPLPIPPQRSELDILLEIIADNENDDVVLSGLTQAYEQLITTNNELDILILTLSELLYDKANSMKDKNKAKNIYRASRITKRLAHNLYRRYKLLNPNHSNPKFLQFVD